MGVKRAVQIALKTTRQDTRIFTSGPLIHNRQAVEALQIKGIEAAVSSTEISSGVLIVRAHGMPREEIEQLRSRGVNIVDATCPHVLSSQHKIKKYSDQGYFVVIVGDRRHPEIISLQSFAPAGHVVIETQDEVDQLPEAERAIVIAQTTFNEQEYEAISGLIRKRYGKCLVFDSICQATSDRQQEVHQLAGTVDAVVVVGGKNSANTRRLAEIAHQRGIRSFHVETAVELNEEDFKDFTHVGVTAGASTPNWITADVINRLKGFGRVRDPWRYWLFALTAFLLHSNLLVSMGAAMLSVFTLAVYRYPAGGWMTPEESLFPMMAFFYTYAMYTLNRQRKTIPLSVRRNKLQMRLSGVSIVLALIVAFVDSNVTGSLLALALLAGYLYQVEIRKPSQDFPNRWFNEIPLSKDLFTAAAMTIVVGFLPLINRIGSSDLRHVFALCLIFLLTFIKTVALDLMDIEGDRLIGKETLPVVIGKKQTEIFLALLSLSLGVFAWYLLHSRGFPRISWLILSGPLYTVIYLVYYKMIKFNQAMLFETIVETKFVFLGLLGLMWMMIS